MSLITSTIFDRWSAPKGRAHTRVSISCGIYRLAYRRSRVKTRYNLFRLVYLKEKRVFSFIEESLLRLQHVLYALGAQKPCPPPSTSSFRWCLVVVYGCNTFKRTPSARITDRSFRQQDNSKTEYTRASVVYLRILCITHDI